MVKKIWAVFAEIRQMDARIVSTGGTIELDGKIVVRDVQTTLAPYKKYIAKVVTERNSFIKTDLIQIVGSAMHTMPEAVLFDEQARAGRVEGVLQLVADRTHRGDGGDGDQSRDQAIFDGGRAVGFAEKLLDELHVMSPIEHFRDTDQKRRRVAPPPFRFANGCLTIS